MDLCKNMDSRTKPTKRISSPNPLSGNNTLVEPLAPDLLRPDPRPYAGGVPKQTESAGKLRFRTEDDERVRSHRKSLKNQII